MSKQEKLMKNLERIISKNQNRFVKGKRNSKIKKDKESYS